jgi:PiT family inorganic phosphate transporter
MGVGLANSLLSKGNVFGEGVNWAKANEVGLSLLISPLVGFCGAAALLLLAKSLIQRQELFRPPDSKEPPPSWIRGLLILTCTGVSFAHGSNDGQKGMGLIMLILVGILPGVYALNLGTPQPEIAAVVTAAEVANRILAARPGTPEGARLSRKEAEAALSDYLKTTGVVSERTFAGLMAVNQLVRERLNGKQSIADLPHDQRQALRSDIYLASETIHKLDKQGLLGPLGEVKSPLINYTERLDLMTKFIPAWVKVAVALALGIGTMIGWKRIVVTVGEKIGKEHLTYAQGASAELVAMTTIGAADMFGLPVSTTHVLSSGIAGTMAANHSGLQMSTLRNIALAWLLTMPVCVFLGAALFALALNLILFLGIR